MLPFANLNSSINAKIVYLSFFQIELEIRVINKSLIVVYSSMSDISYGNSFWTKIFSFLGATNSLLEEMQRIAHLKHLIDTRVHLKLT